MVADSGVEQKGRELSALQFIGFPLSAVMADVAKWCEEAEQHGSQVIWDIRIDPYSNDHGDSGAIVYYVP